VVELHQIPVDEASVRKLLEVQKQQFQSMGVTLESVEGALRRLPNQEAIVLDYKAKLPAISFQLKQRQVFFPGGGKTYIVTCTAKAASFAKHFQTFENILASFKVPAPTAAPAAPKFDWKPALMGGIIGGAAGGLIGLFKLLAGGKKRRVKAEKLSSTGEIPPAELP
jgi:hypothetical protein